MARVIFSALVDEISGKLSGSVFQSDAYGTVIRQRVSPRNPRSQLQQLRRGIFAYRTAQFRSLTNDQKTDWRIGSPAGLLAMPFFTQSNINLSLADQPVAHDFISSATPVEIPFTPDNSLFGEIAFRLDTTPYTVPASLTILCSATPPMVEESSLSTTGIFSPITSYPPGTDMSLLNDITIPYVSRFGDLASDRLMYIALSAIDNSSGLRSIPYSMLFKW